MRTFITTAFVLGLLGATAACGNASEVTTAPAQRPASTTRQWTLDGPGRRLTSNQAGKAVLSTQELPGQGWEETPDVKSGFDLGLLRDVQPGPCTTWVDDVASGRRNKDWNTMSGKVFRQKPAAAHSPVYVSYFVFTYPSADLASQLLTLGREGVQQCGSFTGKYDGKEASGEVTSKEFDRPGDDSVVYRVVVREKTDRGFITHQRQSMRMQVGHNLVSVNMDSDEELDEGTLRSVLQAGLRRLEIAAKS